MTSKEELAEIVERVRFATDSIGDADHRLREIAFEKILEHELASGADPNGLVTAAQERESSDDLVDTSYSSPQMRADAVARYFGIDPESTGELFDLSGEEPTLHLPSARLGHSKAERVREITLLVCGVRTALGIDTGSRHIRTVVEQYGDLDTNFVAHLTEFDKVAVRGKPGSQNRLVRMRATGAEESRALAQRLVSNGLG